MLQLEYRTRNASVSFHIESSCNNIRYDREIGESTKA